MSSLERIRAEVMLLLDLDASVQSELPNSSFVKKLPVIVSCSEEKAKTFAGY